MMLDPPPKRPLTRKTQRRKASFDILKGPLLGHRHFDSAGQDSWRATDKVFGVSNIRFQASNTACLFNDLCQDLRHVPPHFMYWHGTLLRNRVRNLQRTAFKRQHTSPYKQGPEHDSKGVQVCSVVICCRLHAACLFRRHVT